MPPIKKSSFKNVFKNVGPFHHMNKKVTRPPVQYHPPRVKATIRHCYIYIHLKETVPREFSGTAIYSYIHLKETVPREFSGTAIYSYIHLKETVPREFSGTAIYICLKETVPRQFSGTATVYTFILKRLCPDSFLALLHYIHSS